MALVRIGWQTVVACWRCGWPVHFEAGFWWKLPAYRDGRGEWHPARLVVYCSRCHCAGAWDRANEPRIGQARRLAA